LVRTSGSGQTCIEDDVRVLSEAATEVRDVLRAGTPTHGRLRDGKPCWVDDG
jgi:hypothetical protein